MLLDQVEDRDRALLAMLLEHAHPDDIAATLGISASALSKRRTRVINGLRYPPTRQASPMQPGP